MTTIAYNHADKQIAWDSRSTNNGTIVSDKHQMMMIVKGVRFWFTGVVTDQREFIDMYFGKSCGEFAPECYAYVYDNELFYCGVTDKGELWREPIDCNHASGSGGVFAMSAMVMGMSAKDAVSHAKKLDIYSGGLVRTFNIK